MRLRFAGSARPKRSRMAGKYKSKLHSCCQKSSVYTQNLFLSRLLHAAVHEAEQKTWRMRSAPKGLPNLSHNGHVTI